MKISATSLFRKEKSDDKVAHSLFLPPQGDYQGHKGPCPTQSPETWRRRRTSFSVWWIHTWIRPSAMQTMTIDYVPVIKDSCKHILNMARWYTLSAHSSLALHFLLSQLKKYYSDLTTRVSLKEKENVFFFQTCHSLHTPKKTHQKTKHQCVFLTCTLTSSSRRPSTRSSHDATVPSPSSASGFAGLKVLDMKMRSFLFC